MLNFFENGSLIYIKEEECRWLMAFRDFDFNSEADFVKAYEAANDMVKSDFYQKQRYEALKTGKPMEPYAD